MAKPTKAQIAYGKARAGGQNPMKITSKEVKRTAKGVVKTAGLAATIIGPGKIIKGSKIAGKGAEKLVSVVRGKRTYYHGSPNEIPKGATLKTRGTGTSSATNKKKVAEGYSKRKLTLTPEGVKTTSGNVYKVKSKSGKVTKTKHIGNAREFNAQDFIVIKKIKPKK